MKVLQGCVNAYDISKEDYDRQVQEDDSSTISSTQKYLQRDVKTLSVIEKLFQVRQKVDVNNLLEWLKARNYTDKAKHLIAFLDCTNDCE